MKKINNHTNKQINQSHADSYIQQPEQSAAPQSPYSVTVDDTTVRLHFKENGDLTSRLTDAFNFMLS